MSNAAKFPLTPQGRVSWSNDSVYEPTSMEEGKEKKYRLTLLFPKALEGKQKELYDAMYAAAEAACKERFGCSLGGKSKSGKIVKSPFRDGSEKSQFAGYSDQIVFVTLSSKMQPRVVDQLKQDIARDSRKFYNGCWAHATYTVYAWDNITCGVGIGLCNVQKVRDDEPFGAGQGDPETDFETVEVAAGDDDSPF